MGADRAAPPAPKQRGPVELDARDTRTAAADARAAGDLGHRADRVFASTYPAFGDRVFVNGFGCTLVDADGGHHLDMTSGIAVLALGHRSPVVAGALRRAADGLVHTSNLFCTPPAVRLAEALVARSFADRVFFCNSGAEAVEAALKFARLRAGYASGAEPGSTAERRDLLHIGGSFHGRTMGALAATDRPAWQAPFAPMPGGHRRLDWDDRTAIDSIDERTAAVILEPIQGEGGIRPADHAWLRRLRERCDATGALLIVDEIQCGLGRTGHLWAHEAAGIRPDLMTLAKPLAGGLPMGAVLMTEDVAAAITPGCHGTTFGGGPAVATVALAVLEAIDETMLQRVRTAGARLRAALEALHDPRIREVRGAGLMLGVVVGPDAGRIAAAAAHERLLICTAGPDTVRFVPPLVATDADLDEAVRRFAAALAATPAS